MESTTINDDINAKKRLENFLISVEVALIMKKEIELEKNSIIF